MINLYASLRVFFYILNKHKLFLSRAQRMSFFLIIILIAMQGASWGFASLQLYSHAIEIHRFYLIVIIVGMSGGAILTLAPSLLAYVCFLLTCCLPLALTLLLESDNTYVHVGYMSIVFIVALLILARRMSVSY